MSKETLGIIIYFILMLTWVIYLTQEMFIIGASSLNKISAKNEKERKQIQVATGLHFDGIEVWLVAAFMMLLAAFPQAFSLTFEYLYIPVFLLLYTIIGRGVSIEVIYKLNNSKWVKAMVNTWTISSILLIFILGIYITNLFLGFPFDGLHMESSFMTIFNVTTLSGGILFVSLSLVSGAAWIDKMTDHVLGNRAIAFVKKTGFIYVVPIALLLVYMGLNNHATSIFGDGLYNLYIFYSIPLLSVVSAIIVSYQGFKSKTKHMFLFSLITMALFVISGFVGTYPDVIHSTVENGSLTIAQSVINRTSGSLMIILVAVIIFYPLIGFYQSWKYKKFCNQNKLEQE